MVKNCSEICVSRYRRTTYYQTGWSSSPVIAQVLGNGSIRVAALKKLLDQNSLDQEKLKLTRSALLEKCSVLIQGFKKRGKKEDEFFYRAIVNKYS